MILATILVLWFLQPGPVGYGQAQAASAPQTQAAPAQTAKPPASSPAPAKTTSKHSSHPKKSKATDCSSSSSKSSGAAADKPRAPQKVIVKNGGSDEPVVQLKNDTPPAKASNEILNTEQLRLATEGNLKKITGRELTANRQEMVNQIKQFMEQSKEAVADGDLERGHNLAVKAKLLSDELVNP